MTITINGSGTITGIIAGGLPDAIITQPELATGVAGNGPAFSAYATATQAISASTWTKVSFPTEEFDTNSNFTSSRFTPTVAGYYYLSTAVSFGGNATANYGVVQVYKNGIAYKNILGVNGTQVFSLGNSIIAYANGTTDYFEIYAFSTQSSVSLYGDSSGAYTYFQAAMVRSAT